MLSVSRYENDADSVCSDPLFINIPSTTGINNFIFRAKSDKLKAFRKERILL